MTDPFDPVSIHGVWPLVRDPASPGGIRFAEIGRDEPSDCVTGADGLPDADLTLRLFRSAEARDAWCDGVADAGGNAVHALPLANDALPAALLVRFDLARNPGRTPETCIRLVGDVPRDVRHARSRARSDRSHAIEVSGWEAAWSTELAAIRSADAPFRLESLDFSPRSTGRLILRTPSGGMARSAWVEPEGDARRITLRMGLDGAMRLGADDLDATLRERAEALGYEVGGDGDLSLVVHRADGDALRRVASDLATLARTRAALRMVAGRRHAVSDALRERPLAILRRLASGFPLAKAPASSTYAYQVNPVSGHAVDADGWSVEALWKAGAIRPAWWSGRRETSREKPLDAYESSVWVASTLGLDLASGRVGVREAADRLDAVLSGLHRDEETVGEFAQAVAVTPADTWSPPEGAPTPARPGKGRLPKRAKDLALLAAWLSHGLAADLAEPRR